METEDALCRGYSGPLKWTFFWSNEDLSVYRLYDKVAPLHIVKSDVFWRYCCAHLNLGNR